MDFAPVAAPVPAGSDSDQTGSDQICYVRCRCSLCMFRLWELERRMLNEGKDS